jgi:hypothetical protein
MRCWEAHSARLPASIAQPWCSGGTRARENGSGACVWGPVFILPAVVVAAVIATGVTVAADAVGPASGWYSPWRSPWLVTLDGAAARRGEWTAPHYSP